MKLESILRHCLTAAALAGLLATGAWAQSATPTTDTQQDRQDLNKDRQDRNKDQRDINHDRRDLHRDRKGR